MVPGYLLAQDLAAAVLAATMPAPSTILVAGCGTGSEILAIARALLGACITGVDPSPGMIAAARRRIDDTGLSGRVRLETATVDALDDRPDHDACIVSMMLHFIADDGGKGAFLPGIHRRLRPDARLALIDPAADEGRAPACGERARRRGCKAISFRPVAA